MGNSRRCAPSNHPRPRSLFSVAVAPTGEGLRGRLRGAGGEGAGDGGERLREMKASGTAREGRQKLCLEDYMDFCDHPDRPDFFVIEQLNHIISMHGFIRMHRRPKAEIISTLEAMELMQAARSTLKESIIRCAPLAVEDVRRDLEAVGWQGCPVDSVRSVGPPAGAVEGAAVPTSSSSPVGAAVVCGSGTSTTALAAAREKARKRKRVQAIPLPTLAAAAASCDTSPRPPVDLFLPLLPILRLGPPETVSSTGGSHGRFVMEGNAEP